MMHRRKPICLAIHLAICLVWVFMSGSCTPSDGLPSPVDALTSIFGDSCDSDDDGRCICETSEECQGYTPLDFPVICRDNLCTCERREGRCGCSRDEHCEFFYDATYPYCTVGGYCAECLTDEHCDADRFCGRGECRLRGCMTEEDCAPGRLCHRSDISITCVDCLDDGDCEDGFCHRNRCVECTKTEHCLDGYNCNTGTFFSSASHRCELRCGLTCRPDCADVEDCAEHPECLVEDPTCLDACPLEGEERIWCVFDEACQRVITECPRGTVCDTGLFSSQSCGNPSCTFDTDCPPGFACEALRCHLECASDDDCDEPERCEPRRHDGSLRVCL